MQISNGRCKRMGKFIFFCAKGKISKIGLQFVFHRDIIANVDGKPPHNKQENNQKSGCGAGGSALPWGGRGRKFKSCHSDQKKLVRIESYGLFHFYM